MNANTTDETANEKLPTAQLPSPLKVGGHNSGRKFEFNKQLPQHDEQNTYYRQNSYGIYSNRD